MKRIPRLTSNSPLAHRDITLPVIDSSTRPSSVNLVPNNNGNVEVSHYVFLIFQKCLKPTSNGSQYNQHSCIVFGVYITISPMNNLGSYFDLEFSWVGSENRQNVTLRTCLYVSESSQLYVMCKYVYCFRKTGKLDRTQGCSSSYSLS